MHLTHLLSHLPSTAVFQASVGFASQAKDTSSAFMILACFTNTFSQRNLWVSGLAVVGMDGKAAAHVNGIVEGESTP